MIKLSLALALKKMAQESGLTYKEWGEKAGGLTYTAVSTPIDRNDMKVSSLIRMANAAGYDVVLLRRENFTGEEPIELDSAGRFKKGEA